ncbi:MAG: type II toxin-antitoxin system RelE/ParE family toxin [Spirochaetota bacterium]|jgi:hypothetical protein
MDAADCTVYIGNYFIIEWYYNEKGDSQAYEYFLTLSDAQKRKLFLLVKRIGDYGKIHDITKFRYEGDNIFALKPQPDRFLSFFVKDKKLIITSGYKKKSKKLPIKEMENAIYCRTQYYKRLAEGTYYGKNK